MITMLIAPIIFLTIVSGIAGMHDMKKVGRVGGKALLYFEVVTTFALVIGIVVANLLKPGENFINHPAVAARRAGPLRFPPHVLAHASVHCQGRSLFRPLGSPGGTGGSLSYFEGNNF